MLTSSLYSNEESLSGDTGGVGPVYIFWEPTYYSYCLLLTTTFYGTTRFSEVIKYSNAKARVVELLFKNLKIEAVNKQAIEKNR